MDAALAAGLAALGRPDPYGYGLPSPRLIPRSGDDAHGVRAYVAELVGLRAQLPRDKSLCLSARVLPLSVGIAQAATARKGAR
jgi:hypothetical protein